MHRVAHAGAVRAAKTFARRGASRYLEMAGRRSTHPQHRRAVSAVGNRAGASRGGERRQARHRHRRLRALEQPTGHAAMHWTVGKVKITKIVELETVGSTRFILPLASNEGRLKMSIHSLVVETPARRIVVDTGLGNDKQGRNVPTWNNRNGPYL